MTKLYTNQELRDMQKEGLWPSAYSDMLETKYADRYEMAKRLHQKMSSEYFFYINNIKSAPEAEVRIRRDSGNEDRNWVVSHSGRIIGYDQDYMLGPHDWYKQYDQKAKYDYVRRNKVYVFQWAREGYELKKKSSSMEFPELEYFIRMQEDFQPILEHYYSECFKGLHENHSKVLYKLMVIHYHCPTATEETFVEHRKHNTERFGHSHCDETLGGLHLGENYQEFEALNVKTDEWEVIPGLTKNECLWMFSEHAEEADWKPTYHRMIHNPDPTLGERYSIIFDLQARKIGED